MARRYSKYSQAEIVKLMEGAGWQCRYNGNHAILSKEGHRTFTITDPVNKNGIAEIQKELGIHITNVIGNFKSGSPLSKEEIAKRMVLAKQLLSAGFEGDIATKMSKTNGLYAYGFSIKWLETFTPEQIAEKIYNERENQRISRKQSSIFGPKEPEVKKKVEPETEELPAMLGLLADIERRLEMVTRTDRISLLGTYLDKLQQTLVDAREMQRHATAVSELANRIMDRLQQGDGK